MRKAVGDQATRPSADADLQADIARRLHIDLLVIPDVTDYRFTKQWKSQGGMFGSSQWTETTYWVALNVRIVKPEDGRLVYSGSGSGSSDQGYGPAVRQATDSALEGLKKFLASCQPGQKQ